MLSRIAVLTLTALTVSACGKQNAYDEHIATGVRHSVVAGVQIYGIAMTKDATYLLADKTIGGDRGTIYRLGDNNQIAPLTLPSDPGCDDRYVSALSGGGGSEVTVTIVCGARPPSPGHKTTFGIYRLDPTIGRLFPLASSIQFNAGPASVAPDGQITYVDDGRTLCSGILEIHDGGASYMDLAIAVGGSHWKNQGLADRSTIDDCHDLGSAIYPASGEGGLAFFAAPPAPTVDADRTWTLMLAKPGHAPTPLLGGIHDPRNQVWYPKARLLVFGATIAGVRGTWAVDPTTSHLLLVRRSYALATATDGGTQISSVSQDAGSQGSYSDKVDLFSGIAG